ncbi:MAG: hypothetical protein WCP45_12300 [Verrucomicrobiota bacterium]
MDWRHQIILRRLSEGCTYSEASTAASVSRISVWNWCQASPEFAQAVVAAREEGKSEREYRQWLRHPFRGLRPPTGRGHGGRPRFRYLGRL